MSHLSGKFVWFEHASHDTAKARAFYEALFGWHVETVPLGAEPYAMLLHDNVPIGGLVSARHEGPPAWQSYLSVPDVDAAWRAALADGARGLMPPTDFPPVGRGATLADPTGAVVSLWTSAEADRPDPPEVPVGAWCWNELTTQDAARASAFYTGLAGCTVQTMDIGQAEPYRVLHASGQARAGIWQAVDPRLPAMWVPYVRVADCDASVAKAASLGASVLMPATEIPGVGRFAMLKDDQGAPIAVIRTQPRAG